MCHFIGPRRAGGVCYHTKHSSLGLLTAGCLLRYAAAFRQLQRCFNFLREGGAADWGAQNH